MTGVFACVCAKAFATRSAASGLGKAIGARLELHGELCSAAGLAFAARTAKERGLDGMVIAGCPLVARDDLLADLARAAGISPSRVLPVVLPREAAAETKTAAPAIARALAALEAMPLFETRKAKLAPEVLVIGAGPAGRASARALSALGHAATVIDAAPTVADPGALPSTVEVLCGTKVESFAGVPGAFDVVLAGPAGAVERRFGAVIVATGVRLPPPDQAPFDAGAVVQLPTLLDHIAALQRHDRPRSVAIVLDWRFDEGKASCAEAYAICRELRRLYPAIEVTLALRDAKVSSLELESRYDEVRESGVAVLKHDGRPSVKVSARAAAAGRAGPVLRLRDEVAGADVDLAVDLVAISPWGLWTPADPVLAALLGLDLDPQDRYQPNDIRLLPSRTNRDGVFAVGACRGETWAPSVARDAAEAALSAHELLAPKRVEVELAHAVVDGDKCVLCLTCVRSCPFRAMRIHAEERRADCHAESCRRCGICVGECPNRAITLPAWSEQIVLRLAGAREAAG